MNFFTKRFLWGWPSAESARIAWIQRALNEFDRVGLEVDGIWGSETEMAVRDFQVLRGLKVDGIVGPLTEAKLAEEKLR